MHQLVIKNFDNSMMHGKKCENCVLCLGSAQFESRARHGHGIPYSLQANPGIVPHIIPLPLLLHITFQFMFLESCHSTLYMPSS